MWTCPRCKRIFKAKNQSHSCVIVNPEDLFLNKSAEIKEMYEILIQYCNKFGNIKIDATLTCQHLVDAHRFLTIKPRKNGLILEFVLNRSIDIFPVIKVVEYGKLKFAHRLVLNCVDDITAEILDWIDEAHKMKK